MATITAFTLFAKWTVVVLTRGRLARPVPCLDIKQALHFQLGRLVLEAAGASNRYHTPFLSNKTHFRYQAPVWMMNTLIVLSNIARSALHER